MSTINSSTTTGTVNWVCYSHFTDEETEGHRSQGTDLRSQARKWWSLDLGPNRKSGRSVPNGWGLKGRPVSILSIPYRPWAGVEGSSSHALGNTTACRRGLVSSQGDKKVKNLPETPHPGRETQCPTSSEKDSLLPREKATAVAAFSKRG